MPRLRDLLDNLEPDDLEELTEDAAGLAEELIDAGADEDKAIAAVAGFLDDLLPLDKLIPGPIGAIAEAHDDRVIEAILRKLRDLVRVDPEKKAERQVRRKARREARRTRRGKE